MEMDTRQVGSWAERPDSLFDLLTDSEVEEIDRLVAAVAALEEEDRRLGSAFAEADHRLSVLSARAKRNPINAAARFLGEAPPLPESTGTNPALSDDPRELRDVLDGLKVRREDAQRSLEDARRVRDREVSRLVRVAATRSAEAYVKHARELWRHWAILCSAQRFAVEESAFGLRSVTQHVFPDMGSSKLLIPGGTELPPLAKASNDGGWGLPVIFSGEDDRGATANAYERFLASLQAHGAQPAAKSTRNYRG